MSAPSFDYDRAFVRNLGLVSAPEQQRLRESRVAIMGAGGIGGVIAHTLARLGVGRLRLCDPDRFDVVNFNRQGGANVDSLGQAKASSVARQALAINPTMQAEAFDYGLDESNADQLLADVDLVVDAIDFFCLDARRLLHRVARQKGIPVIFSAPLGMSATLLTFTPDSMTFDEYFDLRPDMDEVERVAAFLVGVSPAMSQRPYMDLRFSNIAEQYGPSLAPAVMLSAGILGIEALRLLLHRPGGRTAPHYLQYDGYRGRLFTGKLWLGNRGPLQLLKRQLAARTLRRLAGGVSRPKPRSLATTEGA